jgi:hypothetical protein
LLPSTVLEAALAAYLRSAPKTLTCRLPCNISIHDVYEFAWGRNNMHILLFCRNLRSFLCSVRQTMRGYPTDILGLSTPCVQGTYTRVYAYIPQNSRGILRITHIAVDRPMIDRSPAQTTDVIMTQCSYRHVWRKSRCSPSANILCRGVVPVCSAVPSDVSHQ